MKIHFIAIGGSVMHQLAIALKLKGYDVSGSDDDIFNPAKSNLQNNGILPPKIGWHPEKITSETKAVILGMHAKPDNRELQQAQNLGIPIFSFPEYIYEQAKNKKRVVIGGSHGKTTITSMVMHVLRYFKKDFDYLVGAKLAGFDLSVKITNDAPIIIIEGDEYLSSPIHRVPKFHYYQPDVALLSGIAWDHINVFPTFENYVSQFEIFVQQLSLKSVLVYNEEDEVVNRLAKNATHLRTVAYQTPTHHIDTECTYLRYKKEQIPLQIFGQHNLQNLSGAREVCQELGINANQFYEAIQSFKGAARRLELVEQNEHCAIFKDFAHAPSKVTATTNAVKEQHAHRQLIACFELHTYSSLNKDFLPQYQNALQAADLAIVFYNQHTFDIKKLPALSTKKVQESFKHPNLQVFTNGDELLNFLKHTNYHNTDLLMMSSGNFGGVNIPEIAKFALANSLDKKLTNK